MRTVLKLSPEQSTQLAHAVSVARGNPELSAAIRDVYARAAKEVDARRPRCDISGRCCRFEQFGHRLFVTTAELAVFTGESASTNQTLKTLPGDWIGEGCPFQVGALCSVRDDRPFGCRAFFCDPTATEWQQDHYERFHAELKAIHERFGVPYFYVEWREALRAVLR